MEIIRMSNGRSSICLPPVGMGMHGKLEDVLQYVTGVATKPRICTLASYAHMVGHYQGYGLCIRWYYVNILDGRGNLPALSTQEMKDLWSAIDLANSRRSLGLRLRRKGVNKKLSISMTLSCMDHENQTSIEIAEKVKTVILKYFPLCDISGR